MCLTIPNQIIKIQGKKAFVKKGRTLDIRLLPKIKIGDWVLAENGFAVAKVTKKEAEESLKLVSQSAFQPVSHRAVKL